MLGMGISGFSRGTVFPERLDKFASALDFIGGATWWWRTSRCVSVNDLLSRWIWIQNTHSHGPRKLMAS